MSEGAEPIRSAFYEPALARGAEFVEFDGWWWVNGYGDAVAEHEAVRANVGLWDVSPLRKWEFTGPDALRGADWILTNDVRGMNAGEVRYGPFCDEDGRMVGDGTVFKFSETRCWVVTATDSDREHFGRALARLGDLDLEIAARTPELPQLQVQGPQSRELLGRLAPSTAELDYFHFLTEPVDVDGVSCVVSRTGYSGEIGYEIFCEPDGTGRLWDALLAAGAEFGLSPYGLLAVETLRIESGLIFVGYDYFAGETDPFEMSLDKFIRLDKPDFFGKDALVEISQAPPRRFVTVAVDGEEVPEYGASVFADDREVGQVRSPCLSPTLGRVIALTAIDSDLARPGTRVNVAVASGRDGATVERLPLYDPDKRRPRS